jgi:hypothetical protein
MNRDDLEENVITFSSEFSGKPVYSPGSGHEDEEVLRSDIPNSNNSKSEIYMHVGASPIPTCQDARGSVLDEKVCYTGLMTAIDSCKRPPSVVHLYPKTMLN